MEYRNQKGFTLIELSIVVVVIALIVAGVVAGQALVTQAQLKAQISQIHKFTVVLNSFRLQYDAMPGDIANASAYWSETGNCPVGDAPVGCDGDGNGIIEVGVESFRFWQHLALANLIGGSYTGLVGVTHFHEVKVNHPAAKFKNGGVQVHEFPPYGYQPHSSLMIGGIKVSGGDAGQGLFMASEAKAIDDKIDDGLADKGNLLATGPDGVNYDNSITECTSGDWADTVSSYNLNVTEKLCRLFVLL